MIHSRKRVEQVFSYSLVELREARFGFAHIPPEPVHQNLTINQISNQKDGKSAEPEKRYLESAGTEENRVGH